MSIWNTMINLSPAQKIAASLIAKDAVGCVVYTTTARKNKNYTPEKRADVANYDLANGVINIGLQLLAIKPIEKAVEKFSDTKIMKHFFKDLDKQLASNDNKAVMKLLKHKNGLVKGSAALITTILCQYFIKRFISPYFSMPTADFTKKIGLIKPKVYAGETYNKSGTLDIVEGTESSTKTKEA